MIDTVGCDDSRRLPGCYLNQDTGKQHFSGVSRGWIVSVDTIIGIAVVAIALGAVHLVPRLHSRRREKRRESTRWRVD